jgi:hypothetical protein
MKMQIAQIQMDLMIVLVITDMTAMDSIAPMSMNVGRT